ncbi:hypothetical protein [Sinomonas flava]|uniref:hypothetical protein n=1 Tax=Sinomonas flava TaxID=496857 RepID=UPI0039A51CAA
MLDLRAHDRLVPFTRVTEGMVSAAELLPGHRFVACTMVGRYGFDDVMVVESVEPPSGVRPGHARIVKGGKLVRGAIELTVSAHDGGAAVRWQQDFGLGRLGGPALAAAAFGARLGYRAVLQRLLRG